MTADPEQRMRIVVEDDPRAAVVRPVGLLDLPACVALREALLKCSAGEPPGIVVDLAGMALRNRALLSVFTAVSARIAEWPGIPLLLAAPTRPVAALLDRTGVARFVRVHPSRAAALEAVTAPPLRRLVKVRLAEEPGSVARARRLVDRTCREWGLGPLSGDARLIASELVTNVLRHAHCEPLLRLEWTGERFVVAVADSDPNPPVPMDPPLSRPSGRGLRLIARTSACWGYAPTASGGKIVWASLRRPGRLPGLGGAPDPAAPGRE